MKSYRLLFVSSALLGLALVPSPSFAKTAKECTAEWRADKAAMQAKGMSEKAYVADCRKDAASPAAAPVSSSTPAAKPASTTVPVSTVGKKTVKACSDEWKADKAGMQAKGMTEKAYVDACRGPVATPKTMSAPVETSPQANPAATSRPVAPAAKRTTTTPASGSTLAGSFPIEGEAKNHCPSDTVVWVNSATKVYHYAGGRNYGRTKQGAYMCEGETSAAGVRAAKNEKKPKA